MTHIIIISRKLVKPFSKYNVNYSFFSYHVPMPDFKNNINLPNNLLSRLRILFWYFFFIYCTYIMIVYKHTPMLSCYYNREKRCLDLHAGFFFFYIWVLHGYMRFLDGPIVLSLYIPTGLFYMHAISNVFFLNQHSCIIFFRIFFFFCAW